MKKVLKSFITFALVALLMFVCLPVVFAESSPTKDEAPEVKTAVVTKSDGTQVEVNLETQITVTSVQAASTDQSSNEKSAALVEAAAALEEVFSGKDYTNAEQKTSQENLEKLLKSIEVDGKTYDHTDYDAKEVFDVSVTAEIQAILASGGTITIDFEYANADKPIVIHQNEQTKEWIHVADDKVKKNGNVVSVEFDSLCPVAFLQLAPDAQPARNFVPWLIAIIIVLVIIIIILIILLIRRKHHKDEEKAHEEEAAPVAEEEKPEEEKAEETPAEEAPVEEEKAEEAPVEEAPAEEQPVEEEKAEEAPVEEAPAEEAPAEEEKVEEAPAEEEKAEEADEDEDEEDIKHHPSTHQDIAVPVDVAPEELVEEEKDEYLSINYNKSHLAKLILLDDSTKQCYQLLKDFLNGYQLTNRLSWKHETFSKSRETLVRIMVRGKSLNVYLLVNPDKYANDPKTPLQPDKDGFSVIKVKSLRRTKYTCQLLKDLMKEKKVEKKKEYQPVNFFEEYKGLDSEKALIGKDLIKMTVVRGEKPVARARQYKLFKSASVYNIHKHMDDNDALNLVGKSDRTIDDTRFGVVFTDELCDSFEDGDTVTLEAIKAKVPGFNKRMTAYKLKPRGKMTKSLTIDCDAFTLGAAKMVALTGGQLLSPSDKDSDD